MMMKRATIFFVLMAILAIGAQPAGEHVTVNKIKQDPYRFENEVVMLTGKVIQRGEEKASSTRSYRFKDDWGGEITIVTKKDYPEVDQRLAITGVVFVTTNADKKLEITFFEDQRESLGGAPPPTPLTGSRSWGMGFYLLILLAVALLIVIAFIVYLITSNRPAYGKSTFTNPSAAEPKQFGKSEIRTFNEDKTFKIPAPPDDKTLHILNGRFKIIDGVDEIKEIKFYTIPGEKEVEFTFGRQEVDDIYHIQLKPRSVSLLQAKLRYSSSDEKYRLFNYSLTNPTRVNSKKLGKEESITLEEGNKIVMGEVIFVFTITKSD
jgi:hypothetical protein